MQDTWYGDHRDLVKWGTLVHLAQSEGIRKIIQVVFLRHADRPPLETDQGEVEIPKEVWEHFRDTSHIQGLGNRSELDIEMFDTIFDPPTRKHYVQEAVRFLRGRTDRKVVLLDPDTGIEPEQATGKHVKVAEIQEMWEALSSGDWLVIYQHAFRDQNWREKSRIKFAQACGTRDVRTFRAPKIAADVAFLAAKKE